RPAAAGAEAERARAPGEGDRGDRCVVGRAAGGRGERARSGRGPGGGAARGGGGGRGGRGGGGGGGGGPPRGGGAPARGGGGVAPDGWAPPNRGWSPSQGRNLGGRPFNPTDSAAVSDVSGGALREGWTPSQGLRLGPFDATAIGPGEATGAEGAQSAVAGTL